MAELTDFCNEVDVYDPLADAEEVQAEYGLNLDEEEVLSKLDQDAAIVLALAHDTLDLRCNERQVIYYIKSVLPESDDSL